MDWTSVYVESGEEDLLIPHLLEEHPTAPRLSVLVSHLYHAATEEEHDEVTHHRLFQLLERHYPASSYTLKALYYLCINFILGVGCLGIPFAFARAGFVLCTCIMLTVTLFSFMTVLWVAESGERLQVLEKEDSKLEMQQQSEPSEGTLLMPTSSTSATTTTRDRPQVDAERYEVIDLVSYYLGPAHKILYQISLMALMYVGLLAYTQVFCGSIATLLWGPGGHTNDIGIVGLPQLVFGIMVIPLSCCDLEEQVAIQSIMASIRFVALGIMILGSTMALLLDDDNNANRTHPPYFAPPQPDDCQMSYTACFSGFGVAFSTALFSQLFQHSVPGLLRPLQDQPSKIKQTPKVFGASLFTTFSFYFLLGTSAASYFGAKTLSSVNLNFSNFTFGLDVENASPFMLTMLNAASSVVVMFPALDTISVFPLIANTLGNNLLAASGPAFVKFLAHHLPAHRPCFTLVRQRIYRRSSNSFHDLPTQVRKDLVKRASKIATVFWRLVAAVPPLVGSLWATDLSFSLLLAGVAGIYVAFFAPSLLQLASCRLLPLETTIFNGWYSKPLLAYPVLLFATFSLGVVLFQIRDALLDN